MREGRWKGVTEIVEVREEGYERGKEGEERREEGGRKGGKEEEGEK